MTVAGYRPDTRTLVALAVAAVVVLPRPVGLGMTGKVSFAWLGLEAHIPLLLR